MADNQAYLDEAAGVAESSSLAGMTPVMAQYWAMKAQHPDCLLFFRMGDFYELFFDDAVAAAAALDIALTHRGKHQGEDIPMCGVPVHSHESYLARLIRRGFRVAICEQMEPPTEARKRGAKAVVHRDVVRLVTPGTLTEDSLLDARQSNPLAALAETGGGVGLAWIDISTGAFQTEAPNPSAVASVLARLEPRELLVPEPLAERADLRPVLSEWQGCLTRLPAVRFDSLSGERRLKALFNVGTLAPFGDFTRAEIAAAGAVLDYVELTQKGRRPQIAPPRRLADEGVMQIDAATRRNLELATTLSGGRKGSVLDLIDHTVTGAGARLLAAWLAAPLTDPAAIDQRLDAVATFVDDEALATALRSALKRCPDLERAISRLALGRGGPRDLAAIRDALAVVADLARLLTARNSALSPLPPLLVEAWGDLGDHDRLSNLLTRALVPEPPPVSRDGQFIVAGFDPALDELRALRDDSRRLILDLEARYVQETGIGQLKIRHNNLLGYYIEVPAKQVDRMPAAAAGPFLQRQSMANATRYATVDLAELERKIARAGDDALALELSLFQRLSEAVLAAGEVLATTARAIACLDLTAALADLARCHRYVRPQVDASRDFHIEGGRHPVVEAMLARSEAGTFVANACELTAGHRLWLLTGPNMAGKSTFLRQNALIAILAQMGSFVPADAARIGVIDRLFSRVGAADDLARGRSTFMVEMVETAIILRDAGPRAFVILDEVGRGTATFDGLSIAWAVVEHLHDVNRCRGLLATHYHELTALAARLTDLACYTMRTKEWRGDVVFLHEVTAGAADRSYGVHVARLAGLPLPVIDRAEEILAALEKGEQSSDLTRLACDLPLFAAAFSPPPPRSRPAPAHTAAAAPPAALAALTALDPDALSPREALDQLYRLKALAVEGASAPSPGTTKRRR